MTRTDLDTYIDELVNGACSHLTGEEILLASFAGENSDFVRFNNGKVRQAGSVQQLGASVDLIAGARHTTASVQLSGVSEIDDRRMLDTILTLREQRSAVPEDPYLLFNTDVDSSAETGASALLESDQAIDSVRHATDGHDMVGIYAAGRQYSAFANSLGQRNWHARESFNLDWSLYLDGDKASKELYAGFHWDDAAFERKVSGQVSQLDALGRTPMNVSPAGYRTYLTPAAMQDITQMLSWGGFSLRSHRETDSPLLKMVTEGATFHQDVTITEDTGHGASPNFQGQGFLKPGSVTLIEGGRFSNHLVSPRSAREYNVTSNAAAAHEAPNSISINGGSIETDQRLAELGTGLYVGNLWYLNFSDRQACRTTGMTRFATFWVEDGEIVAPVNVLRFDDTAFRMLGENLIGLTDEPEMLLSSSSYGARSTNSAHLPGALIDDMKFTL